MAFGFTSTMSSQGWSTEKGLISSLTLFREGLWQYYARFWQRRAAAHQQDWDTVHLPLLSTLAATQEEMSLERLSVVSGVTDLPSARRLLEEAWNPFLATWNWLPLLPLQSARVSGRSCGSQ